MSDTFEPMTTARDMRVTVEYGAVTVDGRERAAWRVTAYGIDDSGSSIERSYVTRDADGRQAVTLADAVADLMSRALS